MKIGVDAIHWLSAVLRSLYAARSYQELHECVISRLHDRFRSTVSACESANQDGSQFSSDRTLGRVRCPPNYELYLWDNPNVLRLLNGERRPVFHLSEAVLRADYERTEYFNMLGRPNSLHDQILTVVWQRHRLTSFAINRDRLFTEAERFILELLQPHLAVAIERVGAHRLLPPELLGSPWIELGSGGRPLSLLPAQQLLLRNYFADWQPTLSPLPSAVLDWLAECRALLGQPLLHQPLHALGVETSRGRLTVRFYPASERAGSCLRLFELPATLLNLARRAQLTTREQQVLHWLAEGKRDAEIAVILGLAPPTVSKHVEHILRKLRVDRRAAAVAAAIA